MGGSILVVEDEAAIRDLLAANLQRAGYKVMWPATCRKPRRWCAIAARPGAARWLPPGVPGLTFARRLRSDQRTKDISIVLLSGRVEEQDKVITPGTITSIGPTDAALVGPALPAAERQVARRAPLLGREPAVVGREDDDGVVEQMLGHSSFVPRCAYRVVHRLDHRGVHRVRLRQPHLRLPLVAKFVLQPESLALLPRSTSTVSFGAISGVCTSYNAKYSQKRPHLSAVFEPIQFARLVRQPESRCSPGGPAVSGTLYGENSTRPFPAMPCPACPERRVEALLVRDRTASCPRCHLPRKHVAYPAS